MTKQERKTETDLLRAELDALGVEHSDVQTAWRKETYFAVGGATYIFCERTETPWRGDRPNTVLHGVTAAQVMAMVRGVEEVGA